MISPCFPRAAHQPWGLKPCQAPAGPSRRFEMPKPFLGCLLQTHQGDLPLPGVLPRLHWALLPSQPGWGGLSGHVWSLDFVPSFPRFSERREGTLLLPQGRGRPDCLHLSSQAGPAASVGPGGVIRAGPALGARPCPPPGHPDYGGPLLPCAAAIARRAWDTRAHPAAGGMPGGLPGGLTPGQGPPSLEHPLLCIAGGQSHG